MLYYSTNEPCLLLVDANGELVDDRDVSGGNNFELDDFHIDVDSSEVFEDLLNA